ncbi:MAG TPA: BtrH N-terminal domain-containing protein, partial [Bacilli bacterium]|nr:BtrH N-terminal domain-containing protein [Bacilli bacterium]
MKTLVDSSRLFPGVDSPYLDCVADNLAILLLHAGAEEARSPFACQWRFAFDPQRVDWLGVLFETPYPELVEHQTGCRIVRGSVDPEDSLEALRPLVEAGRPVLMFGDVYHMPWLPYFGRVHQEHSFLIDGVSEDGRMVHIVDAYDNATEWGRALPIACELPVTALPVILDLESENAKTYWVLERVEEEAPSIDLEA